MRRHLRVFLAATSLLFVSLGCGLLSDDSSPEIVDTVEEPQPAEDISAPVEQQEETVEEESPPLAEDSLPESWDKYEGRGVSLSLPSTFLGGNLEEDVELIAEELTNFGPEFEAIAQVIKQNPSLFALWVFDSEIGDSQFLTNVNITTEEVPSAVDLNMYLDLTVNQFPAEFSIVEREVVPFQDSEAGRLVIEFALAGTEGKELLYIIKQDNVIWAVTYATSAAEFDDRLPIFEQSIRTFAVTSNE